MGTPSAGDLRLLSVPAVCGVELSLEDYQEFVAAIESGGAAVAARRPPAAQRILNSKACRSAVMFGDALSVPECAELLRRLAGCRYPFQCAHGRPSMTPLVTLPR